MPIETLNKLPKAAQEMWEAVFKEAKAKYGEDRANQELVLKQNTNYIIRVTNDTALNNWFGYLVDWYEHTNLS